MSIDQSSLPALRTSRLTVQYGGVCANSDIDLEVHAGEVVGLIGPNGAGKTSFIDAISGFTPYTGQVWLGDVCIDKLPAHRRYNAGLARTWQSGELFDELTVAENISVASRRAGLGMLWRDLVSLRSKRVIPEVDRVLDAVGLDDLADRRPSELSLGQRKLLGVARALAGNRRMMLLDEPAAGLSRQETEGFGNRLRRIAKTGVGTLLVDHDMSLVLEFCDRVYVLDFGVVIATGSPAQIAVDERVLTAYLGAVEPQARAGVEVQ